MPEYFLSKIMVYPIKSLGWIEPEEWEVQKRGFKLDRRWMLVDEEGNFVSQRKFPQLAILKTEITSSGILVKNSFTQENFEIPFEIKKKKQLKVKIFNDETSALYAGNQASNFFSNFLKTKVKLVFMPEEFTRPVNPAYGSKKDIVSFADGFPYLLINTASVVNLNKRLKKKIPAERFRPNLIIEGKIPFEEDGWSKIKIGEIIFKIVKPCSRCTVITVNQKTGEKEPEPLKVLSEFRKVENKVMFGENLIAAREGKLKIGDKIEILE